MIGERRALELVLYVSSSTGDIEGIVEQVRSFLADRGLDESALTVVDVVAEPARAEMERILATPTLVKLAPAPVRRIIGSFVDHGAVATALGLEPPAAERSEEA